MVTVLVATYNHERFLNQALDSVLAQVTSFTIEIVVGEDCSTDGTRALLEMYAARHPGVIRMVLAECNLGANLMYMEMLRVARGEYFALLDGDDYWTCVDKLEKQVHVLDARKDVALCFHDLSVVDEAGTREPRPDMDDLGRTQFGLGDLLARPFIPVSSILHRRFEVQDLTTWLARLAPDWEDLVFIDWLTLIYCGLRGDAFYLETQDGVHRVHGGGVWSRRDRLNQIEQEMKVLTRLQSVFGPLHGQVLRNGLRRCTAQLAVERTGLPYDRPLVVVSAPGLEPWYFNGRQTVCVSAQPHQAASAQIEALRRAPSAATAAAHWRARPPLLEADDVSVYCLVMNEDEGAPLTDYLVGFEKTAGFAELHNCATCNIYSLPRSPSAKHGIDHVRIYSSGNRHLLACHLDSPVQGDVTSTAVIMIVGWVLANDGAVVEIWVQNGSQVLARGKPDTPRPDLVAAFPAQPCAATAGFRIPVDLIDVLDGDLLVVTALIKGGQYASLATITVTRA